MHNPVRSPTKVSSNWAKFSTTAHRKLHLVPMTVSQTLPCYHYSVAPLYVQQGGPWSSASYISRALLRVVTFHTDARE